MNFKYNFSASVKLIPAVFLLVILCAMNGQAQTQWTKDLNNPVLIPGSSGEWDDGGFAGQSVLYDSNEGIYKMWYGASDGNNFRIGYATSSDEIGWTKYDDPSTSAPPYAESDPVLGLGPGAFETVWVYFPQVIFDGTTYHMWYAGTNGTTDRVGYATSPDGIVWTKDTQHNPVINVGASGTWDDAAVDPGPVQYDGTTFEMIYNGSDGPVYQGGYATSTDGFTWNKSPDIVLPVGSGSSWDYPRVNPSSVAYNSYLSKYFMFYTGGVFGYWKIGYAVAESFEGPWTKHPSVMMEGTPGEWDEQTTAFPYVLYDPDEELYKMWYMGTSATVGPEGGKIGYATAVIILPVELTSFAALSDGKEIILSWTTATELNNRGFEIQRSIDGTGFFTVGFVEGKGTTTNPQRYSYSDKNPGNGKIFYRLKQVDFNGSYEYSDVIEVDFKAFNSYLLEQNYPNPFNPTTTIGFGIQQKSNVKISILNALGEEVAVVLNEEKESGYHQVEFNAANLPSGVYFYQIKAGEYTGTKKMILLR